MQQHEKWLSKAEDDLNFARLGLKNEFYAQVCFLAQQCIEKSLKAFLLFQGRLYPKTHKLVELWTLCSEIGDGLSQFKEKFKIIDEYYMPTRYPDAVPGTLASGLPSEDNAREALNTAESVYLLVKNWVAGLG
jgi:HEPN domain-containing protein